MILRSDCVEFTPKSLRPCFRHWHNTTHLGQTQLASHPLTEHYRQANGFQPTQLGRGMALRQLLREAVRTLRPIDTPPDPHAKQWRPYLAITEQFFNGYTPEFAATQLHIAKRTFYRAQTAALQRIAESLQKRADTTLHVIGGLSLARRATHTYPDDVVTEWLEIAKQAKKRYDIEKAHRAYNSAWHALRDSTDTRHIIEQKLTALDGRGWCLRLRGDMITYAADNKQLVRLAHISNSPQVGAYALWRKAYAAVGSATISKHGNLHIKGCGKHNERKIYIKPPDVGVKLALPRV